MAKIVRYELVDDIDGSQAERTLRFSVDGEAYEIELNDKHLAEFHKSMRRWVRHARPALPAQPIPSVRKRGDGARIRKWALAHGIKVAAKGRIPTSVRQRYYAESVSAAFTKRDNA